VEASLEWAIQYYFTISMQLKSDLLSGVVSLERDNSVVFYYLSAVEIGPDKKEGL